MRKWGRRRRPGDDQGFSLVEIVVTMGIMSVVMAVISTAFIQIYAGVKRIDQTSVAADQLDISFGRLDRELRYATYVSPPGLGVDGTRWYIEFAIPPRPKLPADVTAPEPRCRQLQFDLKNKVLRMANWELPSLTPGTPAVIASGVALDGNPSPFTVYEPRTAATTSVVGVVAHPTNKYSMIQLRFKVTVGTVVQPVDSTFTSQNITSDTIASAQTDKRCSQVGKRP